MILVKLVFFWFGYFSAKNEELVSLHVVTRHGDRYPVAPLKGYEDYGYSGRLTDSGQLKCEGIGKSLKSLYHSFLPLKYDSELFRFRSTKYNRTIESLHLIFKGLYNLSSINSELPIIIYDNEVDMELSSFHACPTAFKFYKEYVDNPLNFQNSSGYMDKIYKALNLSFNGNEHFLMLIDSLVYF
jgi:hypothetical protein